MRLPILIFVLSITFFSCGSSKKKEKKREPNSFAIVIHGGAGGGINQVNISKERQKIYEKN